jgi:hypothetical protein
VEIWGCVSQSNISIILRRQSKILRMIANATCYVRNLTLREDLHVPLVKEVMKQRSTIYLNKIEGHVNVLILPLCTTTQPKKTKKELASRPRRMLTRNYFWMILFTLY